MPDIVTGVGIGAPVIGGLLGSKSASSQQKAVTGGLDQSTQLQREQFDYLKQILAPYQQAGTQALPALTGFINQPQQNFSFDYGAYFNSPEYAALSQQSQQAAMRNASATGGLRGGDTQVALASIAPQLAQMARQNAQQEFSLNQGANLNRYNMLRSNAGLGTGATSQLSNAAQNFGQIAGQNAVLAGQARADAIGQRNNAIGGGLTGLLSLF